MIFYQRLKIHYLRNDRIYNMVSLGRISKDSVADFSIIPSLQCNLSCSFCMYNSSIVNSKTINEKILKSFISDIEWNLINSIGLYGGEPSINLKLYERIIKLLPTDIPKFTITNGSWSLNSSSTKLFLDFVLKYNLKVFVSSNYEQRCFQDNKIIKTVADEYGFVIKSADIIIPMGRASKNKFECNKKCLEVLNSTDLLRLAVLPTGIIIFQNCNGIYPIIGTFQKSLNSLIEDLLNYRRIILSRNRISMED